LVDVEKLIEKFDLNNTGTIDFSEFLLANFNYKKNLNEDKLRQIFAILDLNKDGSISLEELKEFFHVQRDEHHQMIKEML